MIGLFAKLVNDGRWAGTIAADVKTGIVCAANAQSGATPITNSINVVSTAVAGVTDSVILPKPAGPGETLVIANDDDGTIDVYPHVGGYINALSQNASFTMATGKRALFVAISGDKWAAFTS